MGLSPHFLQICDYSMKQLSLLDLPEDPKRAGSSPSLWWTVRYHSMFVRAASDFRHMYDEEPIFHLAWPGYQAFLFKPSQAVVLETATGFLTEAYKKNLWEVDYRKAKTFRSQDIAPQIVEALLGSGAQTEWRPMIMAEITIPEHMVDDFVEKIESLDLFFHHWPAFHQASRFRMFGDPRVLEALLYEDVPGPRTIDPDRI